MSASVVRRLAFLSVFVVLALFAIGVPAARVDATGESISLKPDNGLPGDDVTVNGSGFVAGATVDIIWAGTAKLQGGKVDPDGTFGLSFTVPDATGQDPGGSGRSSIAAFVSNETAGLTLRRVTLVAGKGTDGASGGAPTSNLYAADAGDLQGNGANGATGGTAKDCPCKTYGDSVGGAGWNAGSPAGDGGAGSATPATAAEGFRNGAGGAGQTSVSASVGGHPGADGVPRTSGGLGATTLGVLSASGWLPAAGTESARKNSRYTLGTTCR